MIVLCSQLSSSCSGGRSSSETSGDSLPEDILVTVDDSTLTLRDVAGRLPAGLSPEDSTSMLHSIVDGWIERMLLARIAEENSEDMEEIDRLVEDYRKKLIIASYRRKLRETHSDGVSDKEVAGYFKAHGAEMILEAPVIKGLYVKLPTDASRLSDVRRWMMTATPDAIDNLEKYGLDDAVEYSLFQDRWMDWESIARQIPYNFGNPDEFISKRHNFETTHRGFTYFLHISSSLASGNPMPKETADPIIRELLSNERGDRFEQSVIAGLYRKAQKEGRLKLYNYEPEGLNE